MSTVDNLVLRIMSSGGRAAAAEVEGVRGAVGGLGTTARMAGGVMGLGALAFGLKDIAKAAIDFQAKQATLQNALKNTGQNAAGNVAKMTDAADALATHGGFNPTTQIQGMTRLVSAHENVTEAIKNNALVTNISRASHLDYERVLRAVMMAEQGRTTGLSRMGIIIKPVTAAVDALTASHKTLTPEVKKLAKEQDAHATKVKAFTMLWKTFGGATAAYSKTAAGGAGNLKNQIEELGRKLGTALLPTINKVIHAISTVVDYFMHHKAAAQALLIVIGALTVGMLALGVATTIAASPWLLLVAALAAGAFLVIKHWKDVKPIVMAVVDWVKGAISSLVDAWTSVKQAFQSVMDWMKGAIAWLVTAWKSIQEPVTSVWNAIKAAAVVAFSVIKLALTIFVAYFKLAWGVIKGIVQIVFAVLKPIAVAFFDIVKVLVTLLWPIFKTVFGLIFNVIAWCFNAAKAVIVPVFSWLGTATTNVTNWVQTAFTATKDWIIHAFEAVVGFVKSLPGKIASAASGLWDGLKHGLVDVINWIIDRFNGLPMIHGFDIGPVHVPGVPKIGRIGYAEGGVVDRGGVYDVGERGRERVFLPQGSTVIPNHMLNANSTSGSGHQPLENHITLQVGAIEFARAIGYSLGKQKATS